MTTGHALLALAVPRASSRMPSMVRCECGWGASHHGATEAMVRAWHTAHAAEHHESTTERTPR